MQIFGVRDYSIRLWLDPDKLATRNLTAADVVSAVQNQNVQVAAGAVGQQPVPPGQQLQLPLSALGRLETEKQFGDIVLKTGSLQQGGVATPVVRVHDVARVELGAQNYDQTTTADALPSVGLGMFLLPGANALEVATTIKRRMKELESRFPPGLEYDMLYDTTPFISQSVDEVLNTLLIAVLLVALVVLFFLQDWKAADPAHDRRARLAGRDIRGHGGPGLQPEQPDAVRPGAGDRHRGG